MKKIVLVSLLVAAAFPALGQESMAQTAGASVLKDIAQKAVLNSPEVTSKWHSYRAADEEVGVARGGYFPRVDLTVGGGRESLKQPPIGARDNYTRSGYLLSLNQMLFDGFATRNEVRRLDKAKLVRYYELLDASENVALEAGRAYLDVLRYRRLVDLAQDNYVQHKATYDQIQRRTQSGVGRRVDQEQAASRLALAEINLVTEMANLHDVSARYQRLVGIQPTAAITPPAQLDTAFPGQAKVALETLYKKILSFWRPVKTLKLHSTKSIRGGPPIRRSWTSAHARTIPRTIRELTVCVNKMWRNLWSAGICSTVARTRHAKNRPSKRKSGF